VLSIDPKSMTLDALEGSLRTVSKHVFRHVVFRAHHENLNEDRSILSATYDIAQ